MAERIVHFSNPRTPVVACGHIVYIYQTNRRTDDPSKVTCRGCLRSKTFREAKS